jgi:hypothetical protein
VRLILAAPHVAFRSCTDCQTYVYDETTGQPCDYPPHSGHPVPRPPGSLPACRLDGVGCPKGTPEAPRGLTPANQAAWLFDAECRAIGQFPDDPLVRRNALLIRSAMEG